MSMCLDEGRLLDEKLSFPLSHRSVLANIYKHTVRELRMHSIDDILVSMGDKDAQINESETLLGEGRMYADSRLKGDNIVTRFSV